MLIYPFKSLIPKTDLLSSPDVFFGNVKNDYVAYKTSGYFEKSLSKHLVAIRIIDSNGTHCGLVCRTDISESHKGNILKHEDTINKKEQVMIDFVLQHKAIVKPILLTYPKVDSISDRLSQIMTARPSNWKMDFDNGEIQELWYLDKKEVKHFQKEFDTHVEKAIIADGHHRYEAVARLNERNGEPDQFLTCYFSYEDLKILDYNRIVNIQGIMSPIELIARCSKYGKIKPLKKPLESTKQGRIRLYTRGEWYQLKWKKSILKGLNEVESMDASLVNKYIVEKILHIKDVRNSSRLTYVQGDKDVSCVVDPLEKERYKIGIFLSPLSIEQVAHASHNHLPLPPKSTYFEPRIRSGLVVSEWG